MTNGEKIKEIFPNAEISIIKSKSIYERAKVAVDWKFEQIPSYYNLFYEDWWEAEYEEPVIRDNEVKNDLNRAEDELEPTTKIDCDKIDCDKCINHEYCDYEPTTNSGVDCISRQAVLDATVRKSSIWNHVTNSEGDNLEAIVSKLPSVPLQEPKIAPISEIRYDENKLKELVNKSVLTVAPQELRWIPVSEKLPNDRDWYLGIFKEPDTGWINPLPFICDYVGKETKATTKEYWILRGFTDIDKPCDYYLNLECVAWMPLPKPYKADIGMVEE